MNYLNNYTKDVDYYFHTYNNELLDKNEIIQIIKPKKYIIEENIVDINTKSQIEIGKSMCNSVLQVIKLFYENKTEEYDYIILTRIDLFCLKNIDLLLLDKKKINIPYIFYKYNRLHGDDNLIITNSENLKIYYDKLNKSKNLNFGNLHWIYNYIDVNLICDIGKLSKTEK
jgi:hypothetical protein